MTAHAPTTLTRAARAARTAAVVALAACLAACGGSASTTPKKPKPQPPAAVAARDNNICNRYASKVADIVPPAFSPSTVRAGQLPAAKSYLDRVLPLLRSERQELLASGKPDASIGLYDQVMTAFATLVGDYQAADTAAGSGSVPAFKAALRRQTKDGTRLSGLGIQFGLGTCAQG